MSKKEVTITQYVGVSDDQPIQYGFGVRHIQVFLIFLSLTVGYIMRVDMSVGIIAMTDNSTTVDNIEVFAWSKRIQDVILSSFFWGYTMMQIPGGQLAHRYGCKVLLVAALLANGLTTLIIPWAVHLGGWKAICACRVIQGLTQASFYPCIHTFTSKWIPNSERSRLANLIFTGNSIGTIIGMPLSSMLASTSLGWPCIFYVIGSLGILMGGLFWLFGASTPSDHKSITVEEKYYIEKSLKNTQNKKVLKTPWKSIFTSFPVITIAIAHIGANWGFLTLLTQIPTYFKRALDIDVKRSGLLSALPYLAMWLGSIGLSFISDHIVNNNICSASTSRKIFNSIASWGPAVGLICLGYVKPNNEILAIILLIITVGTSSGMNMGYMMNHIDLSPNFGGTLMGITNCVANAVGVLAPIVVGYILKDDTDLMDWRTVFFSTAAVYFVTNLIFVIFANSDIQKWNEPKSTNEISIKIEERNESDESKSMIYDNENNNKD